MSNGKQPEGTPEVGIIDFLRQLIREYAILIVIVETIVIILLTLRLFRVF